MSFYPAQPHFIAYRGISMAFSHIISALPGRRENSPGSQAIPGEPKFEIPGRAENLGIALYRGETSFS